MLRNRCKIKGDDKRDVKFPLVPDIVTSSAARTTFMMLLFGFAVLLAYTTSTLTLRKVLLSSTERSGARRLFLFSKQALSEQSPNPIPCRLEPVNIELPRNSREGRHLQNMQHMIKYIHAYARCAKFVDKLNEIIL